MIAKAFQSKLMRWFKNNARPLPWRMNKDPYRIWVSEIMLQQTQVATVIPYYRKWMERFPDIKTLALASLDEVMPYWAGLGYYRRARMLHEGARYVIDHFNGSLPADPLLLETIPGIGRYSAGAIASIAFEKRAAVVDGNVIRVFTRLFACAKDLSKRGTVDHLWRLAETLLPQKNIGDYNQALMELGATICSPENPSCTACPVRTFCQAHKKGTPTAYPRKSKKEKIEALRAYASILIDPKKQVFIRKQPAKDRWGNLWMFPHSNKQKDLEAHLSLADHAPVRREKISHHFTKYKVELQIAHYQVRNSQSSPNYEGKWVAIADLDRYALPAHHRKIARGLMKYHA